MSLLLDRPSTAAVQAVSQEVTIQCRNRVAEFQSWLQKTVQVHIRCNCSGPFVSGCDPATHVTLQQVIAHIEQEDMKHNGIFSLFIGE